MPASFARTALGLVVAAALATFAHGDVGLDALRATVRVDGGGQSGTAFAVALPAKTEANEAGWPILRRGTVASHPLTPVDRVKTFLVDYAHFGGDSGSAVVVERAGTPLVAGVVVAMQRQTDRVTSPFEEKKVHTPLGLAIAVPADRILQTIDRWREAGGN